MTILTRLEQWKEGGVALSPEQHTLLAGLSRGEPFSVFLELNILLYAGILAFVAGLGWTITTWSQQLGDVVVLTVLSAILATCFWYCFSRAPAWSPGETSSPSLVLDYVLYLGSLIWSVEDLRTSRIGFICSPARSGISIYWQPPVCSFFFSHIVLTTVSYCRSHCPRWLDGSDSPSRIGRPRDETYRQYAILYNLTISGSGAILRRVGLKSHFFGTYLNIAANVLLGALLSGVFNREGFWVWFLCLLAACGASLAWGLARRQFSFVAYAAAYGYVGLSSIFLRDMNDNTAILGYFVTTGVAMLVMLVRIARRFGREA